MTQHQTAGTTARLKLFALLADQGVPQREADDLVAALETKVGTRAQNAVVELDGEAPASRGLAFTDGWDEGVMAVSEALLSIADLEWEQRGGRSADAAELAVHVADARRRDRRYLVRLRTDLMCLERYVREAVLPRTHPHTTERRQVLKAMGEAGGLCTARTVELSSGDIILCTREAGHYDPDDKLSWQDGKPGGWHHCNASVWDDSAVYSHPHTAA